MSVITIIIYVNLKTITYDRYQNKLIKVVYEMLTDGGKFLVLDVPTHGSLTENIKQAAGMCEKNLCIVCSHYPFWMKTFIGIEKFC